MKTISKAIALLLSMWMVLAYPVGVSAVERDDPTTYATIQEDRKGSLTIYKYDLTSAERDGIWDNSYVSTGIYDEEGVNNILGGTNRVGDNDNQADLGNGDVSYGYAIKGVEFTYVKVADLVQFSESAADNTTSDHVEVLYAVDKTKGADFLAALGLSNGANRYTNADALDESKYFYQSDILIDALSAGLDANSTTLKNALETYVKNNGGVAMPLTDSYGKTSAEDLDQGLFLCVESKVPQQVVSSVSPFLVSVPMSTVDGSNYDGAADRWLYDITLYPKNLTGIPSLEKEIMESTESGGSTAGDNGGFAHTATGSAGDTMDFRFTSTLPSITSEATYLSCYGFIDTMAKGLSYCKNDVVLEFYTDSGCTDLITTWKEADGKFSVTYSTTTAGENVMTIDMTERGLSEINTSKAIYTAAGMVNSGYSDCTLRVSYSATINSDASVVYGDTGNPNEVVLTWKRTSQDYYDTLIDDCHTYVYGIDLTKLFSDAKGDYKEVQFLLENTTDGFFLLAKLNEQEGIYYITGTTNNPEEATRFVPVANGDGTQGKVIIKGLEPDSYVLTEIHTDDAYTLLKDDIEIVITSKESSDLCDFYGEDVLGLIQNDPRYATVINDANDYKNIPQKHLEHHLRTASATVDGNDVTMLEDNSSVNAHAPLKVVNTRGFDLPATGDRGVWMYGVIGILLMAGSLTLLIINAKKKR